MLHHYSNISVGIAGRDIDYDLVYACVGRLIQWPAGVSARHDCHIALFQCWEHYA